MSQETKSPTPITITPHPQGGCSAKKPARGHPSRPLAVYSKDLKSGFGWVLNTVYLTNQEAADHVGAKRVTLVARLMKAPSTEIYGYKVTRATMAQCLARLPGAVDGTAPQQPDHAPKTVGLTQHPLAASLSSPANNIRVTLTEDHPPSPISQAQLDRLGSLNDEIRRGAGSPLLVEALRALLVKDLGALGLVLEQPEEPSADPGKIAPEDVKSIQMKNSRFTTEGRWYDVELQREQGTFQYTDNDGDQDNRAVTSADIVARSSRSAEELND